MAINTNKQKRAKEIRIANWPHPADGLYKNLGVRHEDLAQLQLAFQGTIVLPTDPEYDQDRQGNPLYPAYPKIIAYCQGLSDVNIALQWAHNQIDWVVTCRSGGHSTAGFSVNNGMVLDVSRINYVLIDKDLMQARVGAGANWGQVIAELDLNQVHTVTGGCPDVGIAGFTLGGGYGFTSREFGMSLDTILEMTVMLADGTIAVANKTNQYADLFWAMRGGTGNNFGVLLEVVFQLYNVNTFWGFGIRWPLEDAPAALTLMQSEFMISGAPKELGYQTVVATMSDGTSALAMLGMYNGAPDAGKDVLQSLLGTQGANLFYDQVNTYKYLNESLLDDNLNPPVDGLIEFKHANYIAKPLYDGDWVQVIKYFGTSPNKYNIVVIEPYGGAINAIPINDSAFVHRDVYMDFFVDSFFDEAGEITTRDQAQGWLDGFMNLTAGFYNGEMYQNYPLRDYADYRWAYWGDAFNTLLQIKDKYDPHNFFHFEQSISPYPDDPSIHRSKAPSWLKAILGHE
jgi:FAD/FMN-containing dehydrogenase